MRRLLGAGLLIAGCVGAGLAAIARLEGRVRDLEGLVAGLEGMERELGWQLLPLGELLDRAAQGVAGRTGVFFRLCAQGTARLGERSFRQVWSQAARDSGLGLHRADRMILEQLGAVLGRYDGDSQRRALTAAARRLEGQLTQARSSRERLGRLYGTLSAAAGALLAILLI